MKAALVLGGMAIIFMLGCAGLVHYDILKLHPKSTVADNLAGFSIRLEYTVRYQTLLIFWLLFNTLITIAARFKTMALDPLDEKSECKVQAFKNVLTNSFESIVVSVFSQLIFISYAEPHIILKYIPFMNVIQFIGRVAFFAGYPNKRAFGFQCTILPNIVMSLFNVYYLGRFLEFYHT